MARPLDPPVLPSRIHRLGELAYNLWWSWHRHARKVFRTLDYQLWRTTAHNPVLMLRLLAPERLESVAQDPVFLGLYDAALRDLDEARGATDTWWSREFSGVQTGPIAYFSAEFALHQSLPIYAGGLGVLAGDHCKEASDLGLPLIGVGFMYPQGYFRQQISAEGRQVEAYEQLNWTDAPIEPATTPERHPCVVAVPLGDRSVLVSVWRVRVGRVQLFLLDTDLEENAPWDRGLSARLYAGDRELRIQQEIILGIGGVRALRALGVKPAVWHLNEGHAAFVSLQRLHDALALGLDFGEALDDIRRTTVFTTHTPVAAGHDAFPFELVETHLAWIWGTLGPHRNAVLGLGDHDGGGGALFNMTALALRTSGTVNAVSRLHGQVTREMWAPIWPGVSEGQRPVREVTNGIHLSTWIAPTLSKMLDRHMPSDWHARQDDADVWDAILEIPDAELWRVRQALRGFLFTFIRERARRRWSNDRVAPSRVVTAGTLLDPGAFTIGFARRFTAYKRPELIFHDPERLARLLKARRRPIQLVFAGKAHPADEMGKQHIQQICARASDPMFGGRIAFVDDYDLHVARFLVQGCDVWLNTPRKPLEASGTSGMKASVNGTIHLSVGDGWWAEGYTGANGWLIEGGAPPGDAEAVDAADAEALYQLLEHEVVPTYYARGSDGMPTRWIQLMREAIRTVAPRFSARRMLKEYARGMYAPIAPRPDQRS